MDQDFNPVTQRGYDAILTEIEILKKDRPAKIKALAAARALGDLSENAEYSAAKRDLRQLEGRLRYLNKQLIYAQVYTPHDNDLVEIGKTVTLRFQDAEPEVFEIVGTPEADVTLNRISLVSPLGRAIMGHRAGHTVVVEAPNGNYHVQIETVTSTTGDS